MKNIIGSVSFWIIIISIILVVSLIVISNKLAYKEMRAKKLLLKLDLYLDSLFDYILNTNENDKISEIIKIKYELSNTKDINDKITLENKISRFIEENIELKEDINLVMVKINNYKVRFNKVIKDYNKTIKSFPTSLVAKIFSYEEINLFDIIKK